MDTKIIINANREGYSTDQISDTVTVAELIEILSEFPEEAKVYIGNDRRGFSGWYTYGRISYTDVVDIYQDDER